MQAGHAANGSSGWIEICGGENGSYFVETEPGSGENNQSCEHCSFCVTTTNTTAAVVVQRADVLFLVAATEIIHPVDQVFLAPGPEKYWSPCRGPPAGEKKINTTVYVNSLFATTINAGADSGQQKLRGQS